MTYIVITPKRRAIKYDENTEALRSINAFRAWRLGVLNQTVLKTVTDHDLGSMRKNRTVTSRLD